jgi:hypothetical protein
MADTYYNPDGSYTPPDDGGIGNPGPPPQSNYSPPDTTPSDYGSNASRSGGDTWYNPEGGYDAPIGQPGAPDYSTDTSTTKKAAQSIDGGIGNPGPPPADTQPNPAGSDNRSWWERGTDFLTSGTREAADLIGLGPKALKDTIDAGNRPWDDPGAFIKDAYGSAAGTVANTVKDAFDVGSRIQGSAAVFLNDTKQGNWGQVARDINPASNAYYSITGDQAPWMGDTEYTTRNVVSRNPFGAIVPGSGGSGGGHQVIPDSVPIIGGDTQYDIPIFGGLARGEEALRGSLTGNARSQGPSLDVGALQNDIANGMPYDQAIEKYKGSVGSQILSDVLNAANFVDVGPIGEAVGEIFKTTTGRALEELAAKTKATGGWTPELAAEGKQALTDSRNVFDLSKPNQVNNLTETQAGALPGLNRPSTAQDVSAVLYDGASKVAEGDTPAALQYATQYADQIGSSPEGVLNTMEGIANGMRYNFEAKGAVDTRAVVRALDEKAQGIRDLGTDAQSVPYRQAAGELGVDLDRLTQQVMSADPAVAQRGLEARQAVAAQAARDIVKSDLRAGWYAEAGYKLPGTENQLTQGMQGLFSIVRGLMLAGSAPPLALQKFTDEWFRALTQGTIGVRASDTAIGQALARGVEKRNILGQGERAQGFLNRSTVGNLLTNDVLPPSAALRQVNPLTFRGAFTGQNRYGEAIRPGARFQALASPVDKWNQSLIAAPTQHVVLNALYQDTRRLSGSAEVAARRVAAAMQREGYSPALVEQAYQRARQGKNPGDIIAIGTGLPPVVPDRGMAQGSPAGGIGRPGAPVRGQNLTPQVRQAIQESGGQPGLLRDLATPPPTPIDYTPKQMTRATNTTENAAAKWANGLDRTSPAAALPAIDTADVSVLQTAQRMGIDTPPTKTAGQLADEIAAQRPVGVNRGSAGGGTSQKIPTAAEVAEYQQQIAALQDIAGVPATPAEVTKLPTNREKAAATYETIKAAGGDVTAVSRDEYVQMRMQQVREGENGKGPRNPTGQRESAGANYDQAVAAKGGGAPLDIAEAPRPPAAAPTDTPLEAAARKQADAVQYVRENPNVSTGEVMQRFRMSDSNARYVFEEAAAPPRTGTPIPKAADLAAPTTREPSPSFNGQRAGTTDALVDSYRTGRANPDRIIAQAKAQFDAAWAANDIDALQQIEERLVDHAQAAAVGRGAKSAEKIALTKAREDMFGPATRGDADARAQVWADARAALEANAPPVRPELTRAGGPMPRQVTPAERGAIDRGMTDQTRHTGEFEQWQAGQADRLAPFDPTAPAPQPLSREEQLLLQQEQQAQKWRALDEEMRAQEDAAKGQLGYNPLEGVSAEDQVMMQWERESAANPAYTRATAPGISIDPRMRDLIGTPPAFPREGSSMPIGREGPPAIGNAGPPPTAPLEPSILLPQPRDTQALEAARGRAQAGIRDAAFARGTGDQAAVQAGLERGYRIVGNNADQTTAGMWMKNGVGGVTPPVLPFAPFHIHSAQFWAQYFAAHPALALGMAQVLQTFDDYGTLKFPEGNSLAGLIKMTTGLHILDWAQKAYEYGTDVNRAGGNNIPQQILKNLNYNLTGNNAFVRPFEYISGPLASLTQRTTNPLLSGKLDYDTKQPLADSRDLLREYGSMNGTQGLAQRLNDIAGNPLPRNIVSGVANPAQPMGSGLQWLTDNAFGVNRQEYNPDLAAAHALGFVADQMGLSKYAAERAYYAPQTPQDIALGKQLHDAVNVRLDTQAMGKLAPLQARGAESTMEQKGIYAPKTEKAFMLDMPIGAGGFTGKDLLNQPGNYYNTLDKITAAKAQYGDNSPQVKALLGELGKIRAADVAQAPGPLGQYFDTLRKDDLAKFGDQTFRGKLNPQEQNAYDAFNDLRNSADYKRYTQLEAAQAAAGPFGSAGEKAWYAANKAELARAKGIVDAAEKSIVDRFGVNPKELANRAAVAAGRGPTYTNTAIGSATSGAGSSTSPGPSSPASLPRGNTGTGGRSASSSGSRTATGSGNTQATRQAGNDFFDFYKGVTDRGDKAAVLRAFDKAGITPFDKGTTAQEYRRALSVAQDALRTKRAADLIDAGRRTGGNTSTQNVRALSLAELSALMERTTGIGPGGGLPGGSNATAAIRAITPPQATSGLPGGSNKAPAGFFVGRDGTLRKSRFAA